ncbi:MAG: DNA polymerase III subunit delta [Micavibrio aeruginosavorus]|uniref:DNA-directed DNA polymerase n=1 Tax=Micavibrio aeruginosavorus TaxID=349221 RepID=A0A2W5N6I3_9BACT|nr:MAG: DNA polymerase III subunit delta [Micavibrio aeruginosavorus]
MKLAWKDIEPFVKKPDPKARAILVYGPDDGLVKERAAAMGLAVVPDLNDPFNVSLLTGDILSEDGARLSDEAHAMSLMGGTRLIRVDGASDKHTTLLKEYLASPSRDNLVILEAGELGPKSSLRLLFEKSDCAAAVPCYVDDERGVANLIRQTLSAGGYSIQSDASAWLAANIAGDRLRVRAEIDKLMIYMGDVSKTVTLDDARAACGEAGDQSIDDLLYAIGAGRIEVALRAYNKLIEEGVAVVTILRSLQGHFRRLHYTKSLMKDGADVDSAMKKLQPAVFFKNVDPFKAQLRKWPENKLMTFMQRLSQVEAQTKQTGTPVETLCSQVILSLAAQG